MKNIDRIKQDFCSYINSLSPSELYLFDAMLEENQDFFNVKHRFNCKLCAELFGDCIETSDKNYCMNRFKLFCGMEEKR